MSVAAVRTNLHGRLSLLGASVGGLKEGEMREEMWDTYLPLSEIPWPPPS